MALKKYQLEFVSAYPRVRVAKGDFEKIFERGMKMLATKAHLKHKITCGMVQLVLVNDTTIRKINRDYRAKNKPTDVVSLSYFEDYAFPGSDDLVGEIFISVDTAKRQAKEHHMTVKQELQFLFVHGLLHVFGYDHEDEKERKIMFDFQDEILKTKMWRPIIDEIR